MIGKHVAALSQNGKRGIKETIAAGAPVRPHRAGSLEGIARQSWVESTTPARYIPAIMNHYYRIARPLRLSRLAGRCLLAACGFASSLSARAQTTTVGRLLAAYDGIQTLTCEVRKDAEADGKRVRTLSRVCYQRPDRLNVENSTPVKRRIVADGTTFFSYIEGDPKGFSRPIAKLDPEMLVQLRKVPGTAMDHLLHLQDAAETDLGPDGPFAERTACITTNGCAVLCLDPTGRLASIEFYRTAERQERLLTYDYSDFLEVLPGVWIPRLHRVTLTAPGKQTEETSRFSNLVVNQPIAASLFMAGPFFKGVEFVEDFASIYK